MDSRKELLGSNEQRRARIGDRMIAILHNGESGPILFYVILPSGWLGPIPDTDEHVLRTIM